MTVASTLEALADGTRREVVEALAKRPMSAGELAERVGSSPAALTRHLRLLRRAGLVDVALDPDDTRRHIYTVRPQPLAGLGEWVGKVTAYWETQLASFVVHSQRKSRAKR
jgi:DNA-binding transcriptional ArsR family regulator